MQEVKGSNSRNDATTFTVMPLSSRTQVLKSLTTVLSHCLQIHTENYAVFSVVFNQVKLRHKVVWSLKCSIANLVNKSHLKGFHQTQQISDEIEIQYLQEDKWDVRCPRQAAWAPIALRAISTPCAFPAARTCQCSHPSPCPTLLTQTVISEGLKVYGMCRGGDRKAESRRGHYYPTAGRHSLWI